MAISSCIDDAIQKPESLVLSVKKLDEFKMSQQFSVFFFTEINVKIVAVKCQNPEAIYSSKIQISGTI